MIKKIVNVAVAVIENEQGEILISRRQKGQHLAGFWEFPGGKVEQDETVAQALVREIQEELDVVVMPIEHIIDVTFDYPEKTVCLQTWRCAVLDGEAKGNECQEWRWVILADLVNYQFPEANEKILQALL